MPNLDRGIPCAWLLQEQWQKYSTDIDNDVFLDMQMCLYRRYWCTIVTD